MRHIVSMLTVVFLVGCGSGMTPESYNIVVDYFRPPDTCYVNVPSQQTTVGALSSARVEIFDGPDGKAFLELGGNATVSMGAAPPVVLAGTFEGASGSGGWVFSRPTSVADKGNILSNPNTVITSNTKVTLTMTRGGGTTKGALKLESSRSCDGTGCPSDFLNENPACTIDNVAIRGTRVAVQYQTEP